MSLIEGLSYFVVFLIGWVAGYKYRVRVKPIESMDAPTSRYLDAPNYRYGVSFVSRKYGAYNPADDIKKQMTGKVETYFDHGEKADKAENFDE